ncbi:MAG: Peptidase inactive domain protein [Verrucomicrobiaceae bacterium]|nr:Peptidase inactive domain protein [Verrucomicrobiaceae bacterium]
MSKKAAKKAPRKAQAKVLPEAQLIPPPVTATVHTLDNGFEVIVQEDHAHPLVNVQVWVRAGSIHEEQWTGAGLAHLVEHMLFKGTAKRTPGAITQAIQSLGGQVNAYTSFNRTVYWIDGLAENVGGYMDILADMAINSKFDPNDLAKEKDVIRREMAMDNDDPNSAGQHLMQSTAFLRHPLRQPIIGHRQVFDQVERQDVVNFVRRHYAPNNCFLVVAGAVDTDAVLAAAKEHFGAWQRQPYAPVMLPVEAPQHAPRVNSRTFATELTRVSIGWPIPGDADLDKAALDVLAFLLGSGRSSRLFQELREKRGIVHNVWAGAWSSAECGLFSVDAECDPPDTKAATQGLKDVVETIKKKGPTVEELDKAVRSTLAGQFRTLATTRGQASTLGHGWLTMNSLEYSRLYLEAIRKIKPARVQEVANLYLNDNTSNLVVVEPEGTLAKTKAERAEIAKRDTVEKVVLPNGLTLLLGRNPRLPLISMRASFLAGVLSENEENAGITQVTAQMLLKGTKTRSADELSSILEKRGGGLQAHGDAHRLWFAADVVKGDEGIALDVIADLAMNATLPAAQLEQVKKRQIAGIREEQEDPLTVAMRVARKEIFAEIPFHRTALGTEASVKSLTVAQGRTLLKNHLTGANGIISIFGDIDPVAVRKQVQKTLGTLPKGRRHLEDMRDLPVRGKPGAWDRTMEKEQAVLVIGFRTVGLHDGDSQVLSLIDEACSDMGSRLFNRIREDLGLAYYVGTQSFMAYGAGAFYFYVGTDPKKLALAEKEMKGQIADLAKNGLQADELARAKTTWRASWLKAQQGNGALADSLAWDELSGLGYGHFEKLPALIEAVTPADVKRVAKKFFNAKDAFVVRVQPK